MPLMTDEEIGKRIGDGSIFAMAIDTSIFDRLRCDLEHPTLLGLEPLVSGGFKVIVPEVVARELKAHIRRFAAESQASARKAFADHVRRWKLEPGDRAAWLEGDPEDEADRQYQRFLLCTGSVELPVRGFDLAGKALDLYFGAEPPFEANDRKKHEFPDAFALLSLQAFARRKRKHILCVSADKGWADYCETSDELVAISSLDTALSFFNSSGRSRAEEIWLQLKNSGWFGLIYEPVHAAFRQRLRQLDFVADARSSTEFTATAVREDLVRIEFSTATRPLVVAADDETVTFTFAVKAQVIFTARFSFHVVNPFDDEEIEIGEVERDVNKLVEYQLVVVADRVDCARPPVHSVSVDRPAIRVRFGKIEPFEAGGD